MKFIVEDRIFENVPDLYIGVVAVKGVDNSKSYPQIEAMLDESIAAAQQKFDGVKVKTSCPTAKRSVRWASIPTAFPALSKPCSTASAKARGCPILIRW